MQSQVDNSEPPLFFRSRRKNEVVQPADHSIDEFDNADLDLNYILESIEAFNSRILTLEKIQTSDIQQYSPVYSEDAKFRQSEAEGPVHADNSQSIASTPGRIRTCDLRFRKP